MKVIIGVDPHKATHQAVAVDDREAEIDRISVRATRNQTERLLAWSAPFAERVWAVEGAGGLGYLLGQQLVDAGETVVDVPATLAARTRVLASGRSNKTDPNDAWSVAITALRHETLCRVEPASHTEVLRLLAKRNTDIGNQRCRLVSRLHSLLVELAAGGIAKEINASDVDRFLAAVTPATPSEQLRYDLAVELLDDIRRLDAQLKASHRRIRVAITASGTTVTDLFGIGPIIAAALIGYTGDIARFVTGITTRPTTAPPRSSSPPAGAPCTGCPSAATATSTTPSTWRRSASSVSRTRRDGRTSTASSPRARPRRKDPSAEAPDQQRRLPASRRRRRAAPTDPKGPGGHRERLKASVAGSHPYRPALRRSHSRTRTQRYARPTTSVDPARPRTTRGSLLTQRGFDRGHSISRGPGKACGTTHSLHLGRIGRPASTAMRASREPRRTAHIVHISRAASRTGRSRVHRRSVHLPVGQPSTSPRRRDQDQGTSAHTLRR